MKTPLERKIEKYIDDLFRDVGPSQELFDLQEELTTSLRERTADLRSRGLNEEQAFREAVVSMGDLSGLVDDMRRIAQDRAKQAVYLSMNSRVSTVGIVLAVLLILFGIFNMMMLYTMGGQSGQAVTGNGIFVVIGGALFTYSALTRETRRRYAMNPVRATLYAVSIGLVLFGLFTGVTARFATGQVFIGIASTMIFFLTGTGLFLYLALTEPDRSKG